MAMTFWTVFKLGRMRRNQILAIHVQCVKGSDYVTKNIHVISNEALICHILTAQEKQDND